MATTSVNERRSDRISGLPDDLLRRILWNLSTKDSVRTSLLSKRWRYLWKHVPALDLDSFNFPDYWGLKYFFDTFMEESNKNVNLERFRWVYDADLEEHCEDSFVSLMDDVVNRGVSHMTLVSKVDAPDSVRMPLSLYSCATLVSLTLYGVAFDAPPKSKLELVSLPCLKTMHLEAVKFDGASIFETLVSRCSAINELIVVTHPRDHLGVVCVRSPSLRLFKLESMREEGGDPEVVIHAPKLEYMSIINYQSESFIVQSIAPYAKVNIDLNFDVEEDDDDHMILGFLTAISTVQEMTISARTLEIADCYRLDPLPQFFNLTCLHASLPESSWEMFATFLGYCPNLNSLDLEFDGLPETKEIKDSFVPQCFKLSVKFVLLKIPTTVTKTSSKMQLARYFIRECLVLKKLMLNESFGNVINKVKKIPKRVTGCEVVMLNPAYEVNSHGSSVLPMIYENMFIPKILDH
ncbi:PREDICTED: F-box/FBD/LRR-repeat protein At1g80470-like isoform X2 [Camelina sativa]|uniref:F-box/FBD/LRR-repeat protein At1g80470-like isoform X2 n=1 Tax=Camelina sativa TaxID=90675 RepID=A0ABM0SXV2_CAMSA|nr:PREDICTED: F-box/FBD/LRR-repeat protein At1g80470-like isoform X2 [Camelina sativa]